MPGRAVEEDVVQPVQTPVVAVDDDQVAIGLAAKVDVGRRPAFDPMRLGGRLHRNRIERVTPAGCVVDAVAFTPIQERHADLWLGAVNHDVQENSCMCRCCPGQRRRRSRDAGAGCRRC